MGICCCVNRRIESESTITAKNEEEIKFPSYKSISDDFLECLEKDNNLLRYITLVEYVNLLAYYNLETATIPFEGPFKIVFSSKDKFLSETVYEELFQSFIENTILKSKEIYEEDNTFKDMLMELFKSLDLKLKQHYGENYEITKRDLICLGTLFCKTDNITKIKLFFDLFKAENELFVQSEEINAFLISSFLMASYCLISAKKKLSQINPTIPEFEMDDLKRLLQFSQLQDCEILVKFFNFSFFSQKSFTWNEFKQKFMGDNGFGWIFSTKGIRQKLQENNIN